MQLHYSRSIVRYTRYSPTQYSITFTLEPRTATAPGYSVHDRSLDVTPVNEYQYNVIKVTHLNAFTIIMVPRVPAPSLVVVLRTGPLRRLNASSFLSVTLRWRTRTAVAMCDRRPIFLCWDMAYGEVQRCISSARGGAPNAPVPLEQSSCRLFSTAVYSTRSIAARSAARCVGVALGGMRTTSCERSVSPPKLQPGQRKADIPTYSPVAQSYISTSKLSLQQPGAQQLSRHMFALRM